MMSSAGSEPLALPWVSLQSARRIVSTSAPCWTAIEKAIALSRALVSAPLLDLWLVRNSSLRRPSANHDAVAVLGELVAHSKVRVSLARRSGGRPRRRS